MRAGELDQRIAIQRKVDRRTRRGEPVDEWETFAKPWAKVREVAGGRAENYSEDQFISKERREFTTRYVPKVDATCRILWDGREWDVQSAPMIGRREGLRITAEARGD